MEKMASAADCFEEALTGPENGRDGMEAVRTFLNNIVGDTLQLEKTLALIGEGADNHLRSKEDYLAAVIWIMEAFAISVRLSANKAHKQLFDGREADEPFSRLGSPPERES